MSQYEKREKLLEVVRGLFAAGGGEGVPSKILVFVEMKETADFLASYMCQSGLPATSIHGDRYSVAEPVLFGRSRFEEPAPAPP